MSKRTDLDRRILARKIRLLERTGTTTTEVCQALGISRMSGYRLVRELEAFDQEHQDESRAEGRAMLAEWRAQQRQWWKAGISAQDAAGKLYGLLTPFTIAAMQEIFDGFNLDAAEVDSDPLME